MDQVRKRKWGDGGTHVSLQLDQSCSLSRSICCYSDFEDDMPTEIGGGFDPFSEDEDTQAGSGIRAGGHFEDVEETSIGAPPFSQNIDDDQTVLDIPEIGTLGLLWMLDGYRRGKIYMIRDGDMVGKREGKLILDDPKVSTPHCRFRLEKNKFVLWDCGSKNGTFVNGKRITCATTLEENDLVKIGDTTFVLKVMK